MNSIEIRSKYDFVNSRVSRIMLKHTRKTEKANDKNLHRRKILQSKKDLDVSQLISSLFQNFRQYAQTFSALFNRKIGLITPALLCC